MEPTRPSSRLRDLLSRLRAFMEAEVYPLEAQAAGQTWEVLHPLLEEKRRNALTEGLWTLHLAEAWGGSGLSLAAFGRVSEVLGRSPFGHYICNCQAPDVGNMEILIAHGTPEQQHRFLQPLLRGEIRSCFSMTEPEHAGSNPVMLSTTAVKDSDSYVINGHKWFTTAADGAAFAIVMAITDPDAESPYGRASQLIVPTDTAGFRRVRNISVMGEEGGGWMSHAEIVYENCRVPQTHLLGKQGSGFSIAQERLGPGRIHHAMRWIGICERAFELMCAHAAHREIAPGTPLASRQTVQNWIAESRAEINAARLLVLAAAHQIDTEGAYAARIAISVIKFYVAGVLQRVLDRALQTHGALGMTDDTPLAAWFRHERGARIYDGPDEVHKSRVARQIMKQYGVRI